MSALPILLHAGACGNPQPSAPTCSVADDLLGIRSLLKESIPAPQLNEGPSLEPDNRLVRNDANNLAAFTGYFEGLPVDNLARQELPDSGNVVTGDSR